MDGHSRRCTYSYSFISISRIGQEAKRKLAVVVRTDELTIGGESSPHAMCMYSIVSLICRKAIPFSRDAHQSQRVMVVRCPY